MLAFSKVRNCRIYVFLPSDCLISKSCSSCTCFKQQSLLSPFYVLRHQDQGNAHKSTGKVLPENHIQERKEKNIERVIKSIIRCLKEKYRVL